MNDEHICVRCQQELAVAEIIGGWICLPCLRAFSIEVADRLEAAEKQNDIEERAKP